MPQKLGTGLDSDTGMRTGYIQESNRRLMGCRVKSKHAKAISKIRTNSPESQREAVFQS